MRTIRLILATMFLSANCCWAGILPDTFGGDEKKTEENGWLKIKEKDGRSLYLTTPLVEHYIEHYICPKHGDITEYATWRFWFDDAPELNGEYCIKCLAEKAKELFPNVKKVIK